MPELSRRLVLVLAGLLVASAASARAQDLTVFAAASLTNAFEEIGKAYQAQHGQPVRFSFAASSALARQIESGAPAEIFASADEQWMDYLAQRKHIVAETRTSVLGNRLVLIAPKDSTIDNVEIAPRFDLASLIGAGRIATGDPDHVPVGRYAKQALVGLGVWAAVEPRLARADNVRAAMALVERGEAPLGIVYETDAAVASRVKVIGHFPIASHPPISYPMAIVAGKDRPAVRNLMAYLMDSEAAAIYRKYGFSLAK